MGRRWTDIPYVVEQHSTVTHANGPLLIARVRAPGAACSIAARLSADDELSIYTVREASRHRATDGGLLARFSHGEEL